MNIPQRVTFDRGPVQHLKHTSICIRGLDLAHVITELG